MAKSGFRRGAVAQFEKDLLAYGQVADDFVKSEDRDQHVIKQVIESAMLGKGPGDKAYRQYKDDRYRAKKKSAGGNESRFLWGIRTGEKDRGRPHMLLRIHFKWKKISNNVLHLIWKGTGKTGDYASVHNEGTGKMPQREWMHLLSSLATKAVGDLIDGILERHRKAFNAKYGRR